MLAGEVFGLGMRLHPIHAWKEFDALISACTCHLIHTQAKLIKHLPPAPESAAILYQFLVDWMVLVDCSSRADSIKRGHRVILTPPLNKSRLTVMSFIGVHEGIGLLQQQIISLYVLLQSRSVSTHTINLRDYVLQPWHS